MNIQQLEYILAVVDLKHFEDAAEKCCVTQSTLSTMIGRFEDEIGIIIFDRKTRPVSITKEGENIICQLQIILKEVGRLDNVVQELKGEISGSLQIGVIPTVAPYLLPRFLSDFASKFPKLHISVREMTTQNIQRALHQRSLDIGIIAIPLEDSQLSEQMLYNEPFLLYDCFMPPKAHKLVSIEEIDYSHLWLLEEGHCLRTQVEKICKLSAKNPKTDINFEFKAGSIDSLTRFTRMNNGITLLPYLSTLEFSTEEQKRLNSFTSPVPARTIGLSVHKHFVKKKLLKKLRFAITACIDPLLQFQEAERLIKPF